MSGVAELVAGRELLWNLTLRELRGKYKRSTLGWTWSLLNPLSSILIYSIVFGTLLASNPPTGDPSGIHNFTMYLTCALLPWNFTATGVNATLPQLVNNSNLIKKVYFPREYIIGASVLSWVVSFLIELSVLMVVLLFMGHVVVQWVPVLLLLVVLQTVLVLGYSLALSVLNVYFRDVQHFVAISMQAWFFMTPVVYSITLVQDKTGGGILWFLYRCNPMVHFVTAYRNCLYDQRMPGVQSLGYAALLAGLVFAVGWVLFRRLEPRLAEEL